MQLRKIISSVIPWEKVINTLLFFFTFLHEEFYPKENVKEVKGQLEVQLTGNVHLPPSVTIHLDKQMEDSPTLFLVQEASL